MAEVPIVTTIDGVQTGDANEWAEVPLQASTTLGFKKDPTAGTWVEMTKYFPGLGYVTARSTSNTRATKVRFPLTDHPDGDD